MPVGRQHLIDVFRGGNALEGVEERIEGIRREGQAGDVRRDRRQHMVAGEKHAVFLVVETEVIVGVTGRVR